MNPAFIRRVVIRNYKSIAFCDVGLERLMFLVGANGSGKSNFLDAFRFVGDSLRNSLDHALRERGTIKEVRRRSGGHPNNFSLRFEFGLPSGDSGHYEFRIGAKPLGAYEVQNEECRIHPATPFEPDHFFHVQSGKVTAASFELRPATLPDRLYLVAASGMPEFRPIFDALSRIEVYNLDPRAIAAMQRPDVGDVLRRDGSNAASVLQRLSDETHNEIRDNLTRIVPGVSDVETTLLGSQETLEFRQFVQGQKHPWNFPASSMSDGTLRVLAVLLAVFQTMPGHTQPVPPLIGLEEPEVALHPAAAQVLLSALRQASRVRQILVTSHSPDLLDNQDIPAEALLAVDNQNGVTRIGPIDQAGKSALKERLFTPGELLRLNQLTSDFENSNGYRQSDMLMTEK
jgi:predicted ATPase